MGQKEESMIAYYNNPEHFADLMNGWIYRGEKQLTAAQIQEMDTRYTARNGRRNCHSLWRWEKIHMKQFGITLEISRCWR